jgi:hypothetical protein
MSRWRLWAFTGWGLFALSFFVPVHRHGETLADGTLPGWQALAVAFAGDSGPLAFASGLTNLVMLGSILTLWKGSRRFVVSLAGLAAVSALLDAWWLVGLDDPGNLLVGYYLWWLSYVPVAVGLILRARAAALPAPAPVTAF